MRETFEAIAQYPATVILLSILFIIVLIAVYELLVWPLWILDHYIFYLSVKAQGWPPAYINTNEDANLHDEDTTN